MLHQTRVGLVRVVPDLVQRYQLIREPVRRLRLGQVEAVLLLEAEGIVDVGPVGRQLVVVEIQVPRHGVYWGERGVRRAFGNRGVVGVGEVGVGRGRRGGGVLRQLLADDHQVFVLLENLAGNVVRVVVHVLRAVRTHFRPVGVVQRPVVQAWNKEMV